MLFFGSKKILGIDIGTSAIKIAELADGGGKTKLRNYGEVLTADLSQKPFISFDKNIFLLSTEEIGKAIKAVIDEAKIKTRKCVFSIPDYSTFFTNFELPQMTKEEIPLAITTEARKYVPLSLNELTLDWETIEDKTSKQKEPGLKILLVAVPNDVIFQYKNIAEFLKLEPLALEAEVFSLIRSLIQKDNKKVIGLIDIGTRSTTCSIIDKGALNSSHSFDISSSVLTEKLAEGLSVDYEVAEDFKKKYGILPVSRIDSGKNVSEILIPIIDSIIKESEKFFKKFYLTEEKEVEKIILAGGTALLSGLVEHFQGYFKKEVEIANPFRKISYPPILGENLKKMVPSYAIAIGAALRGFER